GRASAVEAPVEADGSADVAALSCPPRSPLNPSSALTHEVRAARDSRGRKCERSFKVPLGLGILANFFLRRRWLGGAQGMRSQPSGWWSCASPARWSAIPRVIARALCEGGYDRRCDRARTHARAEAITRVIAHVPMRGQRRSHG